MRSIRLFGCAVLALVAGCAQRTLTVNSEPSGALVYLNGEEVGRTPLKYDFTFYGDYDVVVRKEGYETLKTHRNMPTPVNMIPPLDLFSELFGVKDRRQWTFSLTPQDPRTADPQALIARGIDMRGDLRSSKYTRKPSTLPTTQPATPPPTTDSAAPPAQP